MKLSLTTLVVILALYFLLKRPAPKTGANGIQVDIGTPVIDQRVNADGVLV